MDVNDLRSEITTVDVTIANGASLSSEAYLGGCSLVGIIMPGTWTAASITFQGAAPGKTVANVYDGNTERAITVAASRFIAVDPKDWAGIHTMKVRSGTAASAVNQEAARTITLVVRPYHG